MHMRKVPKTHVLAHVVFNTVMTNQNLDKRIGQPIKLDMFLKSFTASRDLCSIIYLK